MYNRQTKDNKKWCDLATLTNVYNSDNIHHYGNERWHPVVSSEVSKMWGAVTDPQMLMWGGAVPR